VLDQTRSSNYAGDKTAIPLATISPPGVPGDRGVEERERRAYFRPASSAGTSRFFACDCALVGFTQPSWVGGQILNPVNLTIQILRPSTVALARIRHWMNDSLTSKGSVRCTYKQLSCLVLECSTKLTDAEMWGAIHIIHRLEITIMVTIYSRRAGWPRSNVP
jgi:hypothetical protein